MHYDNKITRTRTHTHARARTHIHTQQQQQQKRHHLLKQHDLKVSISSHSKTVLVVHDQWLILNT
jgi:hypothetical protein